MNSSCRSENCCDSALDYTVDPPPSSEDSILFANIGSHGAGEGDENKAAVAALVSGWSPEWVTTNGGNWPGAEDTLFSKLDEWQAVSREGYETFVTPSDYSLPLMTSMVQQQFKNDLDGPANNLSGLTYSPVTGTLFALRNSASSPSEIYEYDLAGNLLRTIETVNFADHEGICWMFGNRFAITEENPAVSRITVVTILPDTTSIDRLNFAGTSHNTGLAAANEGVEGCGYNPVNNTLYFTTEKPLNGVWQLYVLDWHTGDVSTLFDLLSPLNGIVTDISDMHYNRRSEHLFLLSDESNKIVELTLSGTVVRTMDVAGFTQPEGLTFTDDMMFMFISGEAREFARYKSTSTPRNDFYAGAGAVDRDPSQHKAQFGYFNNAMVYRSGFWQPSVGYHSARRGFVEHFFYDSGYDSDNENQQEDGIDLGSAQAVWLQTSIAASTARWKIVHIHHAGYTSTPTLDSDPTLVGNGYKAYAAIRRIVDRLKDWGADVVLHGHARNYERLNIEGLPVINNGAGGAELEDFGTALDESVYRLKAHGAIKGTATCSRLSLQFYDTDGTLRDGLTLIKN